MPPEDQVPGARNAEPQKGVAAGQGAPTEVEERPGVAQQRPEDSGADPSAEDRLEQMRQQLREREAEAERNMRRLQRSLDSKIAEKDKETQAWRDRYHQAQMQGMDELEQATYMKQVYEDQLHEARSQIQSLQRENENARTATQYLQLAYNLGIDTERLDMSSPETIGQSLWEATIEDRSSLQAELEELRSKVNTLQDPPQEPVETQEPRAKQPPRVASEMHGGPSNQERTWADAQASAEAQLGYKPSIDQLFELVNQNRLPISILPGMEGYPEG